MRFQTWLRALTHYARRKRACQDEDDEDDGNRVRLSLVTQTSLGAVNRPIRRRVLETKHGPCCLPKGMLRLWLPKNTWRINPHNHHCERSEANPIRATTTHITQGDRLSFTSQWQ